MKALVLLFSIFVALSAASAEPCVVIVRHAEKAENDPKDPDLAPAGRARAEALAKILKDARISAILRPNSNAPRKRPRQRRHPPVLGRQLLREKTSLRSSQNWINSAATR